MTVTNFKEDLNKLNQWTDKIERGLVNHSHQYKRSILEAAFLRIILAKDFEPNFILESELVMLKDIAHTKAEHLPEDYNITNLYKKVC